jgi:hypothetical protein
VLVGDGELGGVEAAATSIEYVTDADPPPFHAVIVYVTSGAADVGVPVIAPVEVLKLSPFPIAGEIVKLSIEPPVEVMVRPAMAVDAVALSLVEAIEITGVAIVGIDVT